MRSADATTLLRSEVDNLCAFFSQQAYGEVIWFGGNVSSLTLCAFGLMVSRCTTQVRLETVLGSDAPKHLTRTDHLVRRCRVARAFQDASRNVSVPS